MKKSAVIIAIIFVIFFSQRCYAQEGKIAYSIGQDRLSLGGDMKTCRILCEKYGEAYDDYYNVIRERIIRELEHNYRTRYHFGEVSLFFTLRSNGLLEKIDVDLDNSTKDKCLIDITILSIQRASPFPPFPKGINTARLPFSLIILFKAK